MDYISLIILFTLPENCSLNLSIQYYMYIHSTVMFYYNPLDMQLKLNNNSHRCISYPIHLNMTAKSKDNFDHFHHYNTFFLLIKITVNFSFL